MYKLKQIPEDFVVNELNNLVTDANGKYSYYFLKKKNYNTLDAMQRIADKLHINTKDIGFAGNKDRNAVTRQIISFRKTDKRKIEEIEDLNLKDISVLHVGDGNEKVSLGFNKGNEFFITIRNLSKEEIEKIKNLENKGVFMPNYFGEQRFSKNNHLIGKAIVKRDFEKAIELILESNSDFNQDIENHLMNNKNDFVGALKKVPFKLLKFYIHSYQSFVFNKAIGQYLIKNKKNNEKIPIIGFGTEFKDKEIENIIKKIMKEEKIGLRDFIINAIPDLSQEGSERDLFARNEGFKVIGEGNDELNKGRLKIKINFSLPKGSYATVYVDYLFRIKT